MQQDAHEFLNYLLNTVADILQGSLPEKVAPLQPLFSEERKQDRLQPPGSASGSTTLLHLGGSGTKSSSAKVGLGQNAVSPVDSCASSSASAAPPLPPLQPVPRPAFIPQDLSSQVWVHDIFQGTLTNETRCLNCDTVSEKGRICFLFKHFARCMQVSSKDEDFLDLSVDIDQNTSITHCLHVFSSTETLCGEHKYYCDNCCSKQEAQKRYFSSSTFEPLFYACCCA